MSLTPCAACKKTISQEASACPYCGHPVERAGIGCGGVLAILGTFVDIGLVWFGYDLGGFVGAIIGLICGVLLTGVVVSLFGGFASTVKQKKTMT